MNSQRNSTSAQTVNMTTLELPNCPNFMECPISKQRMEDPVVAGDHISYDRKFIQAWFDKGKTTSPLTRAVISHHLAPNQNLKTQIKEWVDDQLRGRADMQKLKQLQAEIFAVSTSQEALSLVAQISDLVDASKFCLLPTSGVAHIRNSLQFSNVVSAEVSALLVVVNDQCQHAMKKQQTKHEHETKSESTEDALAQAQRLNSNLMDELEKVKQQYTTASTNVIALNKEIEHGTRLNSNLINELKKTEQQLIDVDVQSYIQSEHGTKLKSTEYALALARMELAQSQSANDDLLEEVEDLKMNAHRELFQSQSANNDLLEEVEDLKMNVAQARRELFQSQSANVGLTEEVEEMKTYRCVPDVLHWNTSYTCVCM